MKLKPQPPAVPSLCWARRQARSVWHLPRPVVIADGLGTLSRGGSEGVLTPRSPLMRVVLTIPARAETDPTASTLHRRGTGWELLALSISEVRQAAQKATRASVPLSPFFFVVVVVLPYSFLSYSGGRALISFSYLTKTAKFDLK